MGSFHFSIEGCSPLALAVVFSQYLSQMKYKNLQVKDLDLLVLHLGYCLTACKTFAKMPRKKSAAKKAREVAQIEAEKSVAAGPVDSAETSEIKESKPKGMD